MRGEGPSDYECTCECHSNPEYVHEGHCCFKCPRCHDRVMIHLYNEHKHNCSKAKRLAKRIAKERKVVNPTEAPTKKKKERLVNIEFLGSTKSRHRRPVKK